MADDLFPMEEGFQTPLSPMRFQSQLGKEHKRRYKEGQNIVRLTMAKVVNVNYKYNTVDVVTALYKDPLIRNSKDEGKFSARLPIQFGGRTPDGKPFGTNTLVTVGSLVLIGFIEGSKDKPIVLNIYGETDNQSQLTRTTFTGGDVKDEDIQRELWQLFNLYPSMTYKNIDGHGNQEITFSGKTFMYITDTDPENEYVNDAEFDYEHLPSSRYADGELIEPKSPESPTLLYVHQGVYDDHRVTFFIKSDGTVRYGSRHLDGEGITYQEMGTDGSFTITQKKDTTNPEELSEKFSEMSMDEEGNITLSSRNHTLEIRNDGAFLDGFPLGAIGETRLRDLEEGILDARTAIEVLDGRITLSSSRISELDERVVEQDARLTVAFDEISSKVSRAEYDALARGSSNLLHNTTFTDELIPYGEGTTLKVINGSPNELQVNRSGSSEEFGVYIGHKYPMYLQRGRDYTLSFEGDFGVLPEINKLYIVTREGLSEQIPSLEVQPVEDIWEYPKYTVTFQLEKDYIDTAYLLFAVESTEIDNFIIRKVQLEEGSEATEWSPSYKDFSIVNLYETQISQLADEISLTAKAIESVETSVEGLGDGLDNALARIQEAELKIRPDAIVSTVRESEGYLQDLLEVRQYAEGMIELVEEEVSDVIGNLSDLGEYLDGAFYDGIISETEAQAIEKYINVLESEKADVTAKYEEVYNSSELEGEPKTNLANAKAAYNQAHEKLINTINTVIEDFQVLEGEPELVNQGFEDYRRALSNLSEAFEAAINAIAQKKADLAEQNAKNHADGLFRTAWSEIEQLSDQIALRVTEEVYNAGMKDLRDYVEELYEPISVDLEEVTNALTDLDEYIDGAFHDGIIQESEAQAIQKYINILEGEKEDIDERYAEIINNPDLPSDIRRELEATKNAFNTSHTNLVREITDAIEDGKATLEESLRVDTMFRAYNTTLSSLTKWFEEATNAIAQTKASIAENNAISYTNEKTSRLSQRISQAELKIQPDAIVSTVRESREYIDDLTGKVSKNEVISSINQTAEQILIDASKIRITGDTSVEEGALRWEYSQGGYLRLGGEDNQNGILEVYDSSGELIADLDGDRGGFSDLTVADLEVTNSFRAPGIITSTEESIIYRVRGTRGSDDNVGTTDSWDDALYSFQEAVNRLPKFIDNTVEIWFSNLYDISENVILDGFTGGGTLIIDLRGATYRGYIKVRSCNLRVIIRSDQGGTIERDTGTKYLIDNESSSYLNVSGVTLNGSGHNFGIRTWRGGTTYVGDSAVEIYNVGICIFTTSAGKTYIGRGIGLGTEYGVRTANGGATHFGIRQPMGAVQNHIKTDSALVVGTYQGDSGSARPPAPPTKEVTRTWSASSSGQWRPNYGGQWGGASRTNNPYQGKWNQWGPYKGLWFFGSSVRNAVRGKNIKRIRVNIARINAGGYSSSVPISIRAHRYSSRPSGEPTVSSTRASTTLSRGQRKWVTLPSSFHSLFEGGNYYGIAVYQANASNSNYAIMSTTARIEITYEE